MLPEAVEEEGGSADPADDLAAVKPRSAPVATERHSVMASMPSFSGPTGVRERASVAASSDEAGSSIFVYRMYISPLRTFLSYCYILYIVILY